MLQRERGHVIVVYEEVRGTSAQAAASGTTTLPVDDTTDFPEEGGQVNVNGVTYTYDAVDDTAETLHLTSGLIVSVADNDRVDLYPTVTDRYAIVQVNDAFELTPGLHARIPKFLYPNLPLGTRDPDGDAEWVTMHYDAAISEWVVEDAPGQLVTAAAGALLVPRLHYDVANFTLTSGSYHSCIWTENVFPGDTSGLLDITTPGGSQAWVTDPGVYAVTARVDPGGAHAGQQFFADLVFTDENGNQCLDASQVIPVDNADAAVTVGGTHYLGPTSTLELIVWQYSGASFLNVNAFIAAQRIWM